MEHFYLIANPTKDAELKTAHSIRDYLTGRGKTCIIDVGARKKGQEGYTYNGRISAETDCIIVLGGDGTLLQAATDLAERRIPFLGINMGTLGFLAEVGQTEFEGALDKLIKNEYEIEERMMLAGKSFNRREMIDEAVALNDIVITRKGSLQIINLNIYVNGQFLHRYHADGVIAATPTGSTGYSLSAGGPVVEPGAELIVLSPICPHSMQSRSIVLSPKDTVTVEIESGRDGEIQEVEAIFDGCHKVALCTGEKIEIRKSGQTTGIVKLSQVSFLEVLHRKMSD
ncbi:NAD(+)/NADH kinase [bacterium 1xD8-48]|jgi:NAD+ kinase|nr:NAD(+)/NADH kinase [Lachnospiraceae bacterium]MCI9325263.1 NAD(+)/NADH kinase [Lachnospiraceae bacterium]NBJ97596.1 NAD(+)/NADH kinase [bacterium 1xD8-48]